MAPFVICWFRQDLRLADNPALEAAIASGHSVLPLYILDETVPERYAPGAASRWWLHHSLSALAEDLQARGSRLVLRRGDPARILDELAAASPVAGVYYNRCYEPHASARDERIASSLRERETGVDSFNAALLYEPWQVRTGKGEPYKVFSQFWRKGCLRSELQIPTPRPAPGQLPPAPEVDSEPLAQWRLLPRDPDWSGGFTPLWQPGEAGASEKLGRFVTQGLRDYKTLRNRPDLEHVSRLSPHLHWGEIAPWRAWHAALDAGTSGDIASKDIDHFLSELGWREFSYHLLFNFPTLPRRNWRPVFDDFPWRDDAVSLRAWQAGRTGYPLVDAGMRELWASGWMHNRVRMVVASFLIKHLLIDWREGERWFWDTLVDADLANNSAGWQWVAGSGADAAPYFRIFNPIIQGEKFDPEAAYIRRWLPELARLDDKHIHRPWEAPAAALDAAGITLGQTYPEPIVEHGLARERALAAYQAAKGADD